MLCAARQGPGHADEAQPLAGLLRTAIAQQQQGQRQAGRQQRGQRLDRNAQARQRALHGQRAEEVRRAFLARQRDGGRARGHQAQPRGQVQQHAGALGPQGIDGVGQRPPGQRRPQRPRRLLRQSRPGRRGDQHAEHQRHGLRTLVHQADGDADQRHHPGHVGDDQRQGGRPVLPKQQPRRRRHRQRRIEQQGQPGDMGVTHDRALLTLAEMTSPYRQTHISLYGHPQRFFSAARPATAVLCWLSLPAPPPP